jgi:hypothetical protein
MRQKRIVEHDRPRESQTGKDVKNGCQQPFPIGNKEEQRRKNNPNRQEKGEEALLRALEICHGAQNGSEDGDHNERDGGCVCPVGGAEVFGQIRCGNIGVVDREDSRHDGGGERGICPVVHRPGADGTFMLDIIHDGFSLSGEKNGNEQKHYSENLQEGKRFQWMTYVMAPQSSGNQIR